MTTARDPRVLSAEEFERTESDLVGSICDEINETADGRRASLSRDTLWMWRNQIRKLLAHNDALLERIEALEGEKEILQTALGALRATIKGELGDLILDLGRVEASLDSQTYDEMRKQDDWPDDAEFHVVLTARDLRKISEANTLLVRTMMNALNASEEKADLRAQLAAAREALANMEDNYDGAMADCTSAVDVLIRRINGEATLESAAEWVRLNYPKMAAALSGAPR